MPLKDSDKLKKSLERMLCTGKEPLKERYIYDVVCCVIDEAPSVDAEPVRPAVWRRKDKEQALFGVEWECTNCHDTIALNGILTPIGNGFKFCPYCGAKMKGCEQE